MCCGRYRVRPPCNCCIMRSSDICEDVHTDVLLRHWSHAISSYLDDVPCDLWQPPAAISDCSHDFATNFTSTSAVALQCFCNFPHFFHVSKSTLVYNRLKTWCEWNSNVLANGSRNNRLVALGLFPPSVVTFLGFSFSTMSAKITSPLFDMKRFLFDLFRFAHVSSTKLCQKSRRLAWLGNDKCRQRNGRSKGCCQSVIVFVSRQFFTFNWQTNYRLVTASRNSGLKQLGCIIKCVVTGGLILAVVYLPVGFQLLSCVRFLQWIILSVNSRVS
jgi:hypothetical protein